MAGRLKKNSLLHRPTAVVSTIKHIGRSSREAISVVSKLVPNLKGTNAEQNVAEEKQQTDDDNELLQLINVLENQRNYMQTQEQAVSAIIRASGKDSKNMQKAKD